MLSRMLEKPTNYMTVWGKFFKRSLLIDNNIYFNEELTMSEDSEFLLRYVWYQYYVRVQLLFQQLGYVYVDFVKQVG